MKIQTEFTLPDYNHYEELKPENNDKSAWIGHKGDNFHNLNFNRRIAELTGNRKLKILELGCGDGAALSDFINEGHSCIGLDFFPYWSEFNVGLW